MMRRPPGWIRRLRDGSDEVLAAVRPHDHTAMFAPMYPMAAVRPDADDARVIVLSSQLTPR